MPLPFSTKFYTTPSIYTISEVCWANSASCPQISKETIKLFTFLLLQEKSKHGCFSQSKLRRNIQFYKVSQLVPGHFLKLDQ